MIRYGEERKLHEEKEKIFHTGIDSINKNSITVLIHLNVGEISGVDKSPLDINDDLKYLPSFNTPHSSN